ncbi:MAG: 23S rRNA (uracil(1939)-C(5))-methyltransferase RlmD [Bacteroidota bacterium]
MKRGEELELTVENFASEGKCVARRDGFVIFVSDAVPGDTVRVRIDKVKQSFGVGKAVSILKASPLRTTPPCKYFGVCGGCAWQHALYEAQLQLKRQTVIDAFERIGGFKEIEVLPTVPSDEIYFYRNKIEFSFSRQRWLLDAEFTARPSGRDDFALGFHHSGRYDRVVDVDACLLQSELSNEILLAVKEFCQGKSLEVYDSEKQSGYLRFLVIREGKNTGERMVNLVTFDDRPPVASALCQHLLDRFPTLTTFVNTINSRRAQIAAGELERVYVGSGTITETLGKYRFQISANSFFQTNTKQAEKLFELVKRLGDFKPTDVVYDLYSGAGALSIYVSDEVTKVIGIELVQNSVTDATHNAILNGVTNCHFLQGDLKERLTRDRRWIDEYGTSDVVLVDPPRSGMHPKVVQSVARLHPSRIVYVSCNPATQARDVRSLADAGYRIECIQPLDLFPQTSHIESVMKLVKNG